MNTSKAKKQNKGEREFLKNPEFSVQNVRVVTTQKGKDLVFFTLTLNGVIINNCRVATSSKGDFVSFPQSQGKNGQYYNTVYAPISDADNDEIMKLIQEAIDNG